MTSIHRLFVTAPKEMEPLLAEELLALGAHNVVPARAGVHVEDTLEAAYRICLWSRIANRVLLPLAEFDAPTSDELYARVREIPWSGHFPSTATLAVDAHATSSALRHDRFVEQRIKDAVVDRFRAEEGKRPSVDPRSPDIRINAHIHRDRASIALDLSGDSLHMRGYRTQGGAAPLKENLAAAVLHRAGWPALAAGHAPFIDFMCGSGTLLIEAAQMACDVAPGLTRERYGFLAWHHHEPALWARLLEEARSRREQGLVRARTVLGFDKDRRAVQVAQENVARAGLADIIKVEFQDLTDFRRDLPETGLVAINPPYGKRLGAEGALPELYAAIGRLLREKFLHWQVAVLTDDASLGKALGIRARRIHTLYNGALKCSLLHFQVEPEDFFAARRGPRPLAAEELSDGAGMFRNRLVKNRRNLERWARAEKVECYRVYDADLPDYAVAVDFYDCDPPSIVVQEYEAPSSIDPARAQRRVREVLTVIRDEYGVPEAQVHYKQRRRQRGSSQYERTAATERYLEVGEAGLRLLVNLEDHLDTGLFLDHRPTRALIRSRSAGCSFLNLFAYTGSMTVAAAVGGAARTLTIDLSQRYLDWAERNLHLNGIVGGEHRFERADCMEWLERPATEKFDLIFLDPPTFSNSARMENHFDVQADHERLIDLTMTRLAPGGRLYFSVNARKFRLAAATTERYSVQDISATTLPRDFARRPHVHRCWLITHIGNHAITRTRDRPEP